MSEKKEMIVYHAAPIMLGEGSIVLPGNWGRRFRKHKILSENIFREYVFELTRMKQYPEKPSRLDALFATETYDEAVKYRDANCPADVIYEIRVQIAMSDVHRGSFKEPPHDQLPYVEKIHQQAEKYWSDIPQDDVELVIPAAGCIIRMVS